MSHHPVTEFIASRRSTPAKHLIKPAPNKTELTAILRAANSAPDHGRLQPWRFLIIAETEQPALAEVFAEALSTRQPGTDNALLERERERALRAPLLVAAIARIEADHPKVPAVEQLLAAGAATTQLMLAANAEGFGAVWLTGSRVYDRQVMDHLGLTSAEQLLGLINIGTPSAEQANRPAPKRPDPRVDYWHP